MYVTWKLNYSNDGSGQSMLALDDTTKVPHRACDGCRAKKLRCDGAKPACARRKTLDSGYHHTEYDNATKDRSIRQDTPTASVLSFEYKSECAWRKQAQTKTLADDAFSDDVAAVDKFGGENASHPLSPTTTATCSASSSIELNEPLGVVQMQNSTFPGWHASYSNSLPVSSVLDSPDWADLFVDLEPNSVAYSADSECSLHSRTSPITPLPNSSQVTGNSVFNTSPRAGAARDALGQGDAEMSQMQSMNNDERCRSLATPQQLGCWRETLEPRPFCFGRIMTMLEDFQSAETGDQKPYIALNTIKRALRHTLDLLDCTKCTSKQLNVRLLIYLVSRLTSFLQKSIGLFENTQDLGGSASFHVGVVSIEEYNVDSNTELRIVLHGLADYVAQLARHVLERIGRLAIVDGHESLVQRLGAIRQCLDNIQN